MPSSDTLSITPPVDSSISFLPTAAKSNEEPLVMPPTVVKSNEEPVATTCSTAPNTAPMRSAFAKFESTASSPTAPRRPSAKKAHKFALEVCSSCFGSDPLLADLEDLAPYCGVRVTTVGCLSRCGSGPNCRLETDALAQPFQGIGNDKVAAYEAAMGRGGRYSQIDEVVTHITGFDKSLSLLERALAGTKTLEIPDVVLHRAKLRSDALRCMNHGFTKESLCEAEVLLSKAIDLELESFVPVVAAHQPENIVMTGTKCAAPACGATRLRQLRMLRAEVLGSIALGRHDAAIVDLDAVVSAEPGFTTGYLEKAKILRRMRRPAEALACFKMALEIGMADARLSPQGNGLHKSTQIWVTQKMQELEERLIEKEAIARGEFNETDACDEDAADSGNGSGRWKLIKITGLSRDTCIYHLTNQPPGQPHPCAHDAWHVCVRFGNDVREYTPVSTAAEWERGKLDLLVKTYPQGIVSRRFALLQPVNNRALLGRSYTPLEEQRCWVMVSAPQVTLYLPSLSECAAADVRQDVSNCSPKPSVLHLSIIVGGTGIAPALQLLREIADPTGAFSSDLKVTLLYSSRTPEDVLMLDELRALELQIPDRIVVHHTLTGAEPGDDDTFKVVAPLASCDVSQIKGRHWFFTAKYRPFKPKDGPLRIAGGEEAGLRGHPTAEMLSELLPAPGPHSRAMVCGPPGMLADMRILLQSFGFQEDHIIELKAGPQSQTVDSPVPTVEPSFTRNMDDVD